MRFIYNIGFIFIQILIFYYLSKFFVLSNENNLSISSLDIFQYFIIGVCLLDISYALISSPSIQIEEFKKIGVLEDLYLLPMSPLVQTLASSLFPLFLSLIRLSIYIIFTLFLGGFFETNIINILNIILALIISGISFLGISLIGASFSLLYFRGGLDKRNSQYFFGLISRNNISC